MVISCFEFDSILTAENHGNMDLTIKKQIGLFIEKLDYRPIHVGIWLFINFFFTVHERPSHLASCWPIVFLECIRLPPIKPVRVQLFSVSTPLLFESIVSLLYGTFRLWNVLRQTRLCIGLFLLWNYR